MLNDHLQLVTLIQERLPCDAWPAAFAGIIGRETQEKPEVARYLRTLLHAHTQAGSKQKTSYDIAEELLRPNVDLPPFSQTFTASIGFLPSICHYNDVDPVFDPDKVFALLGMDGTEQQINTAVDAIHEYACKLVVPLRCAVHPYTDCALITMILFAIQRRIRDGKMLRFVAADWANLPSDLRSESPFDFTYLSQDLIDQHYAFRHVKSRQSTGRMLINARRYAAFLELHRTNKLVAQTPTMSGFDFNGHFDPD